MPRCQRHETGLMFFTANLAFPTGARVHPSLKLATWHPRGVLTATLAKEILAFVEAEETVASEPFHRFADLSEIEAIHLNAAEVRQLADRRIGSCQGSSVKSAILAFNPLAFGIAQMYAQLMRRSPIEVRVFCRIGSAAIWLKMPVEILVSAE